MGYSPQGCIELDTTEQVTHTHTSLTCALPRCRQLPHLFLWPGSDLHLQSGGSELQKVPRDSLDKTKPAALTQVKQSSDFLIQRHNDRKRVVSHTWLFSLSSRPTNVNISHSPGIILGPGSSTLFIERVTEEDEGVYHCKASNLKGSAESSAHLTVQGKQLPTHLLPRWVNLPPTGPPLSFQSAPFPDFLLPSPSHWAGLSGPYPQGRGGGHRPATLERGCHRNTGSGGK